MSVGVTIRARQAAEERRRKWAGELDRQLRPSPAKGQESGALCSLLFFAEDPLPLEQVQLFELASGSLRRGQWHERSKVERRTNEAATSARCVREGKRLGYRHERRRDAARRAGAAGVMF